MSDAQAGQVRDRDPDALVAALRDAREAVGDAEAAVDEHGADSLEALRAALRDLDVLFEQYEDDATGTGDFQAYLSFQDDIVALVEGFDDDLPERDAFESLLDLFKQRRLSEADFDEARDRLRDARDLVERLDTLDEAREEYRQTRSRVADAADEYADEVASLERLQRLGNADLDAPVADLRDPIEAYDDAVTDAFETFRREAPAREFLDFVETTEAYPLVGFEPVPEDLADFVANQPAGEEPIPTLLDYAEYSPSKLEHYVDAPRTLKRAVSGNRTYLDRLDADPLTVGWPPAPAEELAYRLDELVSVAARFAGDDVLEPLHAVRRWVRSDDYDRLRDAAVATHELTDAEKRRIEAGVEDDLQRARENEQRLRDALDEN
ncbi:DUF7118 family protein [Halobacterium jilantaiense]|uniref:Uncharacterized protein n=1 Tax=Halobacterium jilantaiense TaxID=355548 RepID=A0A1I0PWV2_9EURY|nr:hypothetical protein [Halobacterium jilantaiense]SEW18981.1 hypothetical protein SAMN04487945_2047 [Halobacterium jilantaiense]